MCAGFGFSGRGGQRCHANSYSPGNSYDACSPCPYGKTTAGPGLGITAADCKVNLGYDATSNNKTSLCPIGTYNDALVQDATKPCTSCEWQQYHRSLFGACCLRKIPSITLLCAPCLTWLLFCLCAQALLAAPPQRLVQIPSATAGCALAALVDQTAPHPAAGLRTPHMGPWGVLWAVSASLAPHRARQSHFPSAGTCKTTSSRQGLCLAWALSHPWSACPSTHRFGTGSSGCHCPALRE